MRELVLQNIEFYSSSDKFSKSLMRWKNFYVGKVHVSEIDFNSLSDEVLLYTLTRIIRNHYSQL